MALLLGEALIRWIQTTFGIRDVEFQSTLRDMFSILDRLILVSVIMTLTHAQNPASEASCRERFSCKNETCYIEDGCLSDTERNEIFYIVLEAGELEPSQSLGVQRVLAQTIKRTLEGIHTAEMSAAIEESGALEGALSESRWLSMRSGGTTAPVAGNKVENQLPMAPFGPDPLQGTTFPTTESHKSIGQEITTNSARTYFDTRLATIKFTPTGASMSETTRAVDWAETQTPEVFMSSTSPLERTARPSPHSEGTTRVITSALGGITFLETARAVTSAETQTQEVAMSSTSPLERTARPIPHSEGTTRVITLALGGITFSETARAVISAETPTPEASLSSTSSLSRTTSTSPETEVTTLGSTAQPAGEFSTSVRGSTAVETQSETHEFQVLFLADSVTKDDVVPRVLRAVVFDGNRKIFEKQRLPLMTLNSVLPAALRGDPMLNGTRIDVKLEMKMTESPRSNVALRLAIGIIAVVAVLAVAAIGLRIIDQYEHAASGNSQRTNDAQTEQHGLATVPGRRRQCADDERFGTVEMSSIDWRSSASSVVP